MTREQVQIDFAQANAAVAIMEEAADILNMADRFHEEYLEMQRCFWQGESAQRFHQLGQHVGERWISRRAQLLAIAAATRDAARRWYEAEMRAIEIAERRERERAERERAMNDLNKKK